jgi:cobalt-zinc-cadmium efflux system outer membrane protein
LAAHDDLVATAETELHRARRKLAALAGDPGGLYDAGDPLDTPGSPGPVETLVSGALAGREDYRGARLRVDEAQSRLAAAKRGWVPSLELTGGLEWSDLGTETATGYVAGIALSIPLFDRGQADQQRAAAARRRAAAESRAIEQRVPALVRAAYETLERDVAQAQRFAEQEAKVDELLRGAEVSYREGERPSIFELLDAYRTVRDVRLRHLELRRGAKSAELDLWRALGRQPEAEIEP